MQLTLRAFAVAVCLGLLAPTVSRAAENGPPAIDAETLKWRVARPYLLDDAASRPHVRRAQALRASSLVVGGIAGGFAATSLAFAIIQEPKNCQHIDPVRCFWNPGFTIMAGVPALVFGLASGGLAFGSWRERQLAGDRYTGSFGVSVDPSRDEVRLDVQVRF